ncbi:retrograde regulation protein 2 [Aureobasidium pullulans]|uniref:Retrograde regulation protein 2 n=1 Tax=Aureobasidium pullulans TaxID=5580 RepID=A0A4S9XED4_AURPU|nr:retrograde regulation protein 2 [Aureobasidium pullulans]
MGAIDKVESDTSSNNSNHVSDSKAFPVALVDEPVIFDAAGKTRESAFDTDSFEHHYKPIEEYEGYHRWDPSFQWEAKEEKKLVRKIDLRICSWVCFMFFALQLDRGNISQALSDNMLTDIGINTNDYNTGQTIFYLCFLFAELPSQMLGKKIGPDNWVPIQMVLWSLVAACQAFIQGRSGFWACRALLGLIEGGFIPDNILYLSYWYTTRELPIRLCYFWFSYQFTSIVSAFLAFGFLHMRGINDIAGWRWLFALEGCLTGIIGVISWFYIPPSPTQTASKFRGKDGWFNEREEKIMVNRVLRDDPSKGDMHNRQALSLGMFWKCLKDYHMWPIYLLGLTWMMPANPMTSYLTLNLKSAGFTTFQVNLLCIPAYCFFIINLLWLSYLSEKVNDRFLIGTISQIFVLPCLIALEVLPTGRSHWATWILSCLVYAQPYIHPVIVAVTSRNGGSVRTRAVATALYNMFVQASSIISSNIYREQDKPYYFFGNKVLIGIVCWNICMFIGCKVFYVTVNKRRDQKWNVMSKEQKEHYLSTTTDEGNKRLDFRFTH